MTEQTEHTDSPQAYTPVDFDPFAQGDLLLTAPATEEQKEIWMSVQMGEEANCAFNESEILRLRGPLDLDALRAALRALIERHEALRMTFTPDGTTLCIVENLEIEIPLLGLSELPEGKRREKLDRITRQEVEHPFDLEHGPLLRVQIVRLAEQEHCLIMTAHHIVCDGWSWWVMLKELGNLYSTFHAGRAPDLPPPDKYSDYALSRSQNVAAQTRSIDEEYWLQQFADHVPVLDLPTDRPRPPLRTFNSAREDHEIDPVLLADLKRTATKAGCSFVNLLLAGFEAFLHRVTGQGDLVVGIAAAGQSVTGQHNLVGHCVNMLPLRTQIDGAQPFSAFLKNRRAALLDAYDHQQFTFGSLINQLDIPRDSSRIPLVPVTFNLDQAIKSDELQFSGIETESSSTPRRYENFELFLNAVETVEGPGNLVLECQYNTDLFDAETICRRLEEFETLLAGIAADPDQPISRLPILTTAELGLLSAWNATEADYQANSSLHQIVEAQAVRVPDKTAVLFEDSQLTYRDLDQRSNQLARHIQAFGAKPDQPIGVYLNRSADIVTGLLGILKSGSAYLPLDPTYPAERLGFMLEDAQAPILLTESRLQDQLPPHEAQVVLIDDDWPSIAAHDTDAVPVSSRPDNLAYVIYTSGSTGKPKGVQISHRAVVNFISSAANQPGLSEQDLLLAVTTISFDISVLEIFLPLSVGATVDMVSRETASDGFKLRHKLETSNTTFMQATPATWQLLVESGWTGSDEIKILSTGEALPASLAAELVSRVPEVWNMYGPTETTVWSTCYRLTNIKGPILIGRPIANTKTYVLDQNRELVPVGVPGELYIGGDGLARGYLNRPQLTEEQFVPDPFGQEPNARLYRTGDQVRYWADGNIEYHKRFDNQIKLRGFRIELGEIEATLGSHPDVNQIVTVVREDIPNDKTLVAYVVPVNGGRIDSEGFGAELRNFLRERLPDYMVPSRFVMMETLPLTPSGKVDRKSLPAPDRKGPAQAGSYEAPQNPIEEEIADIWARVLGLEQVGIHDNFFELGGHSLLAVQIVIQLREAFPVELTMANIFQTPTVSSLAQSILEAMLDQQDPDEILKMIQEVEDL